MSPQNKGKISQSNLNPSGFITTVFSCGFLGHDKKVGASGIFWDFFFNCLIYHKILVFPVGSPMH